MKLAFDYYHNLQDVELRLCNPDERELFPINGRNRNLVLRFNDLSELTFDIDSTVTLSNSQVVNVEAYDYIATKRLVYATGIGWFQISSVEENDDGQCKYKSVTAQSYQSVFRNKGFISEERVYCFYNPSDPYDNRYDYSQDDAIPSVLGQWYKQLGIQQDLSHGLSEPSEAYSDWTVTYISPSLIYGGSSSVCRTFKENVTYGYDWIVNDVEEAFEVVVLFDFMFKTIHVRLPSEITQKANVIYTFDNMMKNVQITENADDIVTVLNCNGDNCDITAVNPTGTNYICDFSYYMDKTEHKWMSVELIAKLEQWESDCAAQKTEYTDLVKTLRGYYQSKTEKGTELQTASVTLQDLKNAQAKRSVLGEGTAGGLCGIVAAETVAIGETSLDEVSGFYSSSFGSSTIITAYASAPEFNAETGKWYFSGASKTGTADALVAANMANNETYWYFCDVAGSAITSYCKLKSRAAVNTENGSASYLCDGFARYIAFRYPTISEGTGNITYNDSVQRWINKWEQVVAICNQQVATLQSSIDTVNSQLSSITNRLNILSYFASTPDLLRELNCYWIEGDYTNENIAVLDSTTAEEEIDLANELLASGYIELSKVCQPRYEFSLDSIDATKIYEFRVQMQALELGKIITIEKADGLWYYPALLQISVALDDTDSFSLAFANALRLDDWGYTYADLVSDASSTSRQISANWQNITAYAKEREAVSSLIKDPLDTTLRAMFANMTNQEFTADQNGILGRKKKADTSDSFEDEQIRVINNVLMFTDDGWETAKTALGKIYYKDDNGNLASSYGLVAETIIGSLIMGECLRIKNEKSTVEINANGITIKKEDGTVVFQATPAGELVVRNYASQSSLDDLGDRVTKAEASITVNAGQIALKASQETVDALGKRVNSAETSITQNANAIKLKASQSSLDDLGDRVTKAEASITTLSTEISAKVSETYGDSSASFGWSLTSSGFYLYSGASTVMEVTPSGLEVNGKITASSGTIAGKLYFGGNNKYYINANENDRSYYIYLPGFRVDDASGAVFSGKLSAATGTFAGSLSAATGSFSGEVTASSGSFGIWDIGLSNADKGFSSGYASQAYGISNNAYGAPSSFYGTDSQGSAVYVSLSNFGIHLRHRNSTTCDFVSWAAVLKCAAAFCRGVITSPATWDCAEDLSEDNNNGRYKFTASSV